MTEITGEIRQRVVSRVSGRRWTIYVCAEPDGTNCASGTHPNILSHCCEAIRKFHDQEGPGPVIVGVEVAPRGDGSTALTAHEDAHGGDDAAS